MSHAPSSRGLPVPTGRLSRLARFGGLATGLAGNALAEGAALRATDMVQALALAVQAMQAGQPSWSEAAQAFASRHQGAAQRTVELLARSLGEH
jgi:hypothetical protein